MMKKRTLFLAAAMLLSVATSSGVGTATADPERSYQGGKALRDSITGTKNNVNDRGFQERLADRLKELGAKAGGERDKSSTSSSSGDKGNPLLQVGVGLLITLGLTAQAMLTPHSRCRL